MNDLPTHHRDNTHAHSEPSRSAPLNIFFVITSMPVGGAAVLLCNLIRRLDRKRLSPHLVCLIELGELGTQLAAEVPTWHDQNGRIFKVSL